MDGDRTEQSRTRQLIEIELFYEVRQCHTEWARASHDERSTARQRFMDALRRFNRLVLENEPPLVNPVASFIPDIH
jgi:hypothetical protein